MMCSWWRKRYGYGSQIVGLGTTALTASYITKVVKEALDEDEDAVSKQ